MGESYESALSLIGVINGLSIEWRGQFLKGVCKVDGNNYYWRVDLCQWFLKYAWYKIWIKLHVYNEYNYISLYSLDMPPKHLCENMSVRATFEFPEPLVSKYHQKHLFLTDIDWVINNFSSFTTAFKRHIIIHVSKNFNASSAKLQSKFWHVWVFANRRNNVRKSIPNSMFVKVANAK